MPPAMNSSGRSSAVGRVWKRPPGWTASTRSAVGAFNWRAVYALRVLVSPEISTARSSRRKASR
jgi:hypothetical protein